MAQIGFDGRAFASFVALLLFGGLIFGSVLAVVRFPQTKSRASANNTPQAIQVVNLTENSASIFWRTQEPTAGFISFGETTSLGKTRLDERDILDGQQQLYRNHIVTLRNLTPKTRYYYTLTIDSTTADRSGFPFILYTSSIPKNAPVSHQLVGKLLNIDRTPAVGYFITLTFEGQSSSALSNTLGAITDNSGEYTIDLGNLRSADGSDSYALNSREKLTVDAIITDEYGNIKTQSFVYDPKDSFPILYTNRTLDITNTQATVNTLLAPNTSSTPAPSAKNNSLLLLDNTSSRSLDLLLAPSPSPTTKSSSRNLLLP